MKRFILVITLMSFGWLTSSGQHLIGYNKDEVVKIVRTEMKGFSQDNSAVNPSFNYLKFINAPGTKTLIVFFNNSNESSNIRLVCDYSEYDFIIKEYNTKFKPSGKSTWEYPYDCKMYQVTLEEKEWYFVVYINEKPESSEPPKKSWLWKLLN